MLEPLPDTFIHVVPKNFELVQTEASRLVSENEQLKAILATTARQNAILRRVMDVVYQYPDRQRPEAITRVLREAQSELGKPTRYYRTSQAWRRLVVAYWESAPDYGLAKGEVARRLGVDPNTVNQWKQRFKRDALAGREPAIEQPKLDPRIVLNDPALLDLLMASEMAAVELRKVSREMKFAEKNARNRVAQKERAIREDREHQRFDEPSPKMIKSATLRALDENEQPAPVERYQAEDDE